MSILRRKQGDEGEGNLPEPDKTKVKVSFAYYSQEKRGQKLETKTVEIEEGEQGTVTPPTVTDITINGKTAKLRGWSKSSEPDATIEVQNGDTIEVTAKNNGDKYYMSYTYDVTAYFKYPDYKTDDNGKAVTTEAYMNYAGNKTGRVPVAPDETLSDDPEGTWKFRGWSENPAYDDQASSESLPAITENKTFYASWTKTIKVIYELGDKGASWKNGTGPLSSGTIYKNHTGIDTVTDITLETDVSSILTLPSGYEFKGWATSSGGSVAVAKVTGVKTDTKVYAIWEARTKVQTYPLEEGYSQISKMQKYKGTDNGKINPILTSYDSSLTDIIGECIVGFNSWKVDDETTIGHTVASNHNMLYSIEFTTDAKEFLFTAVGSLRVSVDEKDGKGYLYTNEEGEVDIEGDNSYLNADGYKSEKFRFIKVSFENSKERNIKIELMGAFANLYADLQYSVKKIEKEKPKTMMFVGDSWTTGQSQLLEKTAVLPYRSYPTIIANNFGMTAINLGVGGTGYTRMTGGNGTNYQERIRYSLDNCRIEPDYIFICGGGNDVTDVKLNPGKKSLADIVEVANECYKYAKTRCPNVIVLGLEYVEGAARYEASEDLKTLNVMLKEKAQENQIPYIDFVNGEAIDESGKKVHENDNFVSDPKYVIDTVHLSYEGYKNMANKLTPVIQKLIKQNTTNNT